MTIELTAIVPGTADARAKGCSCPSIQTGAEGAECGSMLCSQGYFFDPWCPVHRLAVLAEVQRIFGVAQ